MFEIAVVIVFLLLLSSAFVLLPILLVIRAAQSLFAPAAKEVLEVLEEVREHDWRNADAVGRETMVRKACGWRVVGRVVGAGAFVTCATAIASPVIAIMSCVTAWRILKPIKQEMRDACTYRSTGAKDEPRYWC
jgi:hypothetical protein